MLCVFRSGCKRREVCSREVWCLTSSASTRLKAPEACGGWEQIELGFLKIYAQPATLWKDCCFTWNSCCILIETCQILFRFRQKLVFTDINKTVVMLLPTSTPIKWSFHSLLILLLQGVIPTAQRAAIVVGVELPVYDITKKHLLRSGGMGDTILTHFM